MSVIPPSREPAQHRDISRSDLQVSPVLQTVIAPNNRVKMVQHEPEKTSQHQVLHLRLPLRLC